MKQFVCFGHFSDCSSSYWPGDEWTGTTTIDQVTFVGDNLLVRLSWERLLYKRLLFSRLVRMTNVRLTIVPNAVDRMTIVRMTIVRMTIVKIFL